MTSSRKKKKPKGHGPTQDSAVFSSIKRCQFTSSRVHGEEEENMNMTIEEKKKCVF